MHAESTVQDERRVDLIIERRELEPERFLALDLTTSVDSFAADLSAAFGRIDEELLEAGAAFSGPGICARPKRKAVSGRMKVVVGVPFTGEVEPWPDSRILELSGGPALVGTLHGSYNDLPAAWEEMNKALAKGERLRPKAMRFDRFLLSMSNAVNPDELITELVIPLA
jgi:hypothetical protein